VGKGGTKLALTSAPILSEQSLIAFCSSAICDFLGPSTLFLFVAKFQSG
jgi:hypothetical protein